MVKGKAIISIVSFQALMILSRRLEWVKR